MALETETSGNQTATHPRIVFAHSLENPISAELRVKSTVAGTPPPLIGLDYLTSTEAVFKWGNFLPGNSCTYEIIVTAPGNVEAVGDSTLGFRVKNTSLENNPEFKWGDIYLAGVGLPAVALKYRDDTMAAGVWRVIWSQESSGTIAQVHDGDGNYRSSTEAYLQDGHVYPWYRLSSDTLALELGPGGTYVAIGGLVRATNVVTATLTGDNTHKFSVGDSVLIYPGEDGFDDGPHTIASVADNTHFTYAETGDDGASTVAHYPSANTDIHFKRIGNNTWGIYVGGSAKIIGYADSIVFQSGIRNIYNGTTEVAFVARTADTTLDTTHNTVTVDATAGSKTITLPTAVGCPGRQYTVKKIDATANTVILDGNGSQTIDGALTLTLRAQNDSVTIASNNANWHVVSALREESQFLAVSADTTLDASHGVVSVDATAAAKTITLPTAVGCPGRQYTIKKIDAVANTVTVDGAAAETIDGAATLDLADQYDSVTIVSNGANWLVVASKGL